MRSASGSIAATVALVALTVGCGGSDDDASGPASEASAGESAGASLAPGTLTAARFAGTQASPQKPAPPLALRDSFGRAVDLERLRGDAVIVTFLYTKCPDICPLILDNLRTAQLELGHAAEDLNVLAVSVDPEGDTRRAVNRYLDAHRVTHRVRYLIGNRQELEAVWHDWDIVSKRAPTKNDPHFIEHSALVYGVNADGDLMTLYPTTFDPAQIVHDVPILASQ